MVKITAVQLNHLQEPMGVTELPQVSWQFTANHRDCMQTAYQIQLAVNKNFEETILDSGWQESAQSQNILLTSTTTPVQSSKRYFIRIRIIDDKGTTSRWSATASFVTGILTKGEWLGQWVSGETSADEDDLTTKLLQGTMTIQRPVAEAYVHLSAMGMYQAYINGHRVGNAELTPGWTEYTQRFLYQTFDVTKSLKLGKNILGAVIAPGWFKGRVGFLGHSKNYGGQTAFIAQLVVRFVDGSTKVWGSTKAMMAVNGPITGADLYDGEVYDARLERHEWLRQEITDRYSDWHAVLPVVNDAELVPQTGALVMVHERLQVQKVFVTPQGDTVLDFGQNFAGFVEFKVQAPTGSRVVLECFELLDSEGNVYQENLRSAKAKIVYYCRGEEKETYHPTFTYQGFRYVKVTEFPSAIDPEAFTALVIHSDMSFTSDFKCGQPLVNQLHHNIAWGLKSNFVDIPTDCPQRDERLGWTGDAQIFSSTANYLANGYAFFKKWLQDVSLAQRADGGVPDVVPDILSNQPEIQEDPLLQYGTDSASGWADVAVLLPWQLYQTYGDVQILRHQFCSMKRWVDCMAKNASHYLLDYKLQFGDWVALDSESDSYFGATPTVLTSTAYFAHSTRIFSYVCRVLGKHALADEYATLAQRVRDAYQKRFFEEDGRLSEQTQTAHIITLVFDLVPKKWRAQIANQLVTLLRASGGHLLTGFLGTPYFCQALSDNGLSSEAYSLLLQTSYPSWLYQVKAGATTIWEHWDGIKQDGTFWSPEMNSFNHYAYGAVGSWLYAGVLGITMQSPGYQHILIHPRLDARLGFAEGGYQSGYGRICMRWEISEHLVHMQIEIPANTTATVILDDVATIMEHDKILFTGTRQKKATIGSGTYTVTYRRRD